jgi:hypothetical protein
MNLHFESMAVTESVVVLSSSAWCNRIRTQPTRGDYSENSTLLIRHTLEAVFAGLSLLPTITTISLSSVRAVGILRGTQKCPEEAREVLKKITDLNSKVSYKFHSDESLYRQCQQKLLAAGGRVLEMWTLHERLYLSRMERTVNFADISSKVGYPVSSLLELSRHDMNRLFNPVQPKPTPAPQATISTWETFVVSSSPMESEAHPM